MENHSLEKIFMKPSTKNLCQRKWNKYSEPTSPMKLNFMSFVVNDCKDNLICYRKMNFNQINKSIDILAILTRSSPFNVWSNKFGFCSMSNLLNLVKVRCSMSICPKPKKECLSLIAKIWTRSSSFYVRKMMFKFVRCSIKWYSNWWITTKFYFFSLRNQFFNWNFLLGACFVKVIVRFRSFGHPPIKTALFMTP